MPYSGKDIIYNFKELTAKTSDGKYELIPDSTGNYHYWYDTGTGYMVGDWQTGYVFLLNKKLQEPERDADKLNRLVSGEIRDRREWENLPPGGGVVSMECTNGEVAKSIHHKLKDFLVTDLGTFHWHTVEMHIGAWEKASSGIGEKIAQYQRNWTSDFETARKLVNEMDLHEYTDYESLWILTPEGGIIHHYWKIQNNLVTA